MHLRFHYTIIIIYRCRNLPFGGRATRGSRLRFPKKENARSRHQHLFEEKIRKNQKVGLRILRNKGSGVVYAYGRH